MGYIPSSGLAGSYSNSMLDALRNCHMIFHINCTFPPTGFQFLHILASICSLFTQYFTAYKLLLAPPDGCFLKAQRGERTCPGSHSKKPGRSLLIPGAILSPCHMATPKHWFQTQPYSFQMGVLPNRPPPAPPPIYRALSTQLICPFSEHSLSI